MRRAVGTARVDGPRFLRGVRASLEVKLMPCSTERYYNVLLIRFYAVWAYDGDRERQCER